MLQSARLRFHDLETPLLELVTIQTYFYNFLLTFFSSFLLSDEKLFQTVRLRGRRRDATRGWHFPWPRTMLPCAPPRRVLLRRVEPLQRRGGRAVASVPHRASPHPATARTEHTGKYQNCPTLGANATFQIALRQTSSVDRQCSNHTPSPAGTQTNVY